MWITTVTSYEKNNSYLDWKVRIPMNYYLSVQQPSLELYAITLSAVVLWK